MLRRLLFTLPLLTLAGSAFGQHTVTSTAATCPPLINSTGVTGVLSGSGAVPTLDLAFSSLPAGQAAQVLFAPITCNPPVLLPGGNGNLCVCGNGVLGICRGVTFNTGVGGGTVIVDLNNPSPTGCSGVTSIGAGETWNFQLWHREPPGSPLGANTSNGILVVTG